MEGVQGLLGEVSQLGTSKNWLRSWFDKLTTNVTD